MQRKGARQVLASDPERTRKLTQYLIRRLEGYIQQNPDTRPVDVFMAIHNLHRISVLNEANQMKLTGRERHIFFRTAIDTFTQALMREHGRLLEEEYQGGR